MILTLGIKKQNKQKPKQNTNMGWCRAVGMLSTGACGVWYHKHRLWRYCNTVLGLVLNFTGILVCLYYVLDAFLSIIVYHKVWKNCQEVKLWKTLNGRNLSYRDVVIQKVKQGGWDVFLMLYFQNKCLLSTGFQKVVLRKRRFNSSKERCWSLWLEIVADEYVACHRFGINVSF